MDQTTKQEIYSKWLILKEKFKINVNINSPENYGKADTTEVGLTNGEYQNYLDCTKLVHENCIELLTENDKMDIVNILMSTEKRINNA